MFVIFKGKAEKPEKDEILGYVEQKSAAERYVESGNKNADKDTAFWWEEVGRYRPA